MHISRRSLCSSGLLLIALGAGGCVGDDPGASQAKLARVSGDVIVPDGVDAVVNVAVVAPPGDSVWDGIAEVIITNDSPDGGDVVASGGSVELIPGDTRGGRRVGTLVLPLPDEASEFDLSTISINFAEGADPQRFEIGRWKMTRSADEPLVQITGEYPASMAAGGPVVFSVRGDGIASEQISAVTSKAEGASLTDFEAVDNPDGTVEISLHLECDDSFDLYGISPWLTMHTEQGAVEQPLDPILVGYLDMSDEVAKRISER